MALGRVRSRAAFAALAQSGARARQGTVRVRYLPPDPSDAEAGADVAYAVGKPVGTAVRRNRVRRRLRAAVATLDLPAGTYLLGAAPAAAETPFPRLVADLAAAVETATTGALARSGGGR